MKENLDTVKVDGILEKISNVDVYTYDYIDGPKDKLGLMAEDFHEVFKRGSDETINGQEVQMALWLAVQELQKLSATQNELVAAQRTQIADQQQQLAAQEARIKRLEALFEKQASSEQ